MIRPIAFTGPAGVGKSTAAAYLVKAGANRTPKINLRSQSFAQPIKGMIRGLIEMVNRDKNYASRLVTYPEFKETPIPELGGFTPRALMQTLGTEWGRDTLTEDFWVKIALQRINRAWSSPGRFDIVFDDLRFENEAAMIRQLGGLVIGLKGRDTSTTETAHRSESAAPEPDFWVENTGTLEDLHAKLDEMMDIHMKKPA